MTPTREMTDPHMTVTLNCDGVEISMRATVRVADYALIAQPHQYKPTLLLSVFGTACASLAQRTVDAVHEAHEAFEQALATAAHEEFLASYEPLDEASPASGAPWRDECDEGPGA